jgi:hypothetical protein
MSAIIGGFLPNSSIVTLLCLKYEIFLSTVEQNQSYTYEILALMSVMEWRNRVHGPLMPHPRLAPLPMAFGFAGSEG